MNEIIYIVTMLILIVFVAIVLFAVLYNYRKSTQELRDELERARNTNSDTKRLVEQAEQRIKESGESVQRIGKITEQLDATNREIERTIKSDERIFEEIRKNKLEN